MIDLQVEGLSVGSLHNSDIMACPLVGLGQGICAPISPIHFTTIESDSKGVRQIFVPSQHFNVTCAIIKSRVDGI